MANAIDVALYLLWLSSQEDDEPELMTNMRLQKLVYYVQGWSLALNGSPMFSEAIEAWDHGPVVNDLYHRFKNYKSDPIPAAEFSAVPNLTTTQMAFVREIWECYKIYSATQLRNMTHREKPWRLARVPCRPEGSCREVVTHQSMRDYFSRRATVPGISREDAWKGFEDAENDRVVSFDEAFRRARNG